nr:5318_t:CDS:2 [Entrophospora candida]
MLWKPSNPHEDTFIHDYLTPAINPFFADDEFLISEWSSDTLAASKSRKKKFDPVLKGCKPDFVVSVSVVKPPKCRNIGLSDDKVKLGNELKDAIDLMINDQIISKDVIICGLLVDGLKLTLSVADYLFEDTICIFDLTDIVIQKQ